MIRLEHANLVVIDIQPTLEFLLTAFPNWQVRGGSIKTDQTQRNWLHVGDDDNYLTLNDGAVGQNRDLDSNTPGLAHLGFEVTNLNSIVDRLTAKGFAIAIAGRDHPYRKSVYFCEPAGFQFEFIEYNSKKTDEKNMYGGEIGELRHHSTTTKQTKGSNNG
jgi:catechol-2,3-dioxygenase